MDDLTRAEASRLPRRRFLHTASALGLSVMLGVSRRADAESPPETRRLRLVHSPVVCLAPMYVGEELLRMEGFTDIQYVPSEAETGPNVVASGKADLTMWDVAAMFPALDDGRPLSILAGVHAGCQELLGNGRVRSMSDLRGKRIAISRFGNGDHVTISLMLAYVGINPRKDVEWVVGPGPMDTVSLFERGEVDAMIGFAPQPQMLRKRRIGHTLIDTAHDKPWSQYFCCMLAANRDFVLRNPVAAKRALRAVLKAADMCEREPARVARFMTEKGYEPLEDVALEVLKQLPYRWRESNPEDTLRFHALRLREVGMIKSSPQKLIGQGTDWRFLNQIKRELKA
jgi:NitT/TauT family transport system substrate-binding protein